MEMVEDGEEQRGSEAQKRTTGDTMETFSISITPQVLQTIDKEVEDGLWDGRSQAISHCRRRVAVGHWFTFRSPRPPGRVLHIT